MSFTARCPECEAESSVPDAVAGKAVRCRKCGETFRAKAPRERDPGGERPQRKARSHDRDDDDRPRRRRGEDDGRRPGPGPRADPGPTGTSPGALVVLIKGILALVAAFIPCVAPF